MDIEGEERNDRRGEGTVFSVCGGGNYKGSFCLELGVFRVVKGHSPGEERKAPAVWVLSSPPSVSDCEERWLHHGVLIMKGDMDVVPLLW